jgi:hypothetical protein
MDRILTDLLALDDQSRKYGCGLNPRLRLALRTDARFPAVAASPLPRGQIDPDTLPPGVTLLAPRRKPRRKSA